MGGNSVKVDLHPLDKKVYSIRKYFYHQGSSCFLLLLFFVCLLLFFCFFLFFCCCCFFLLLLLFCFFFLFFFLFCFVLFFFSFRADPFSEDASVLESKQDVRREVSLRKQSAISTKCIQLP